ncbi:hypothetical protein ACFVVM_20065 [Nocardia sp. NPDC058176]|uniref:hypothetical protein n=1 Tax=Nocardia sp. NPDC058176 TaxID=3346368 RepID=UPI0036DC3F32
MLAVAQGGGVDDDARRQGRGRHQQRGVFHTAQGRPAARGEEQIASPHHPGRVDGRAVAIGGRPCGEEGAAREQTGGEGPGEVAEFAGAEQVAGRADGESGVGFAVERGRQRGQGVWFEFVVGVEVLDQRGGDPAEGDIAGDRRALS